MQYSQEEKSNLKNFGIAKSQRDLNKLDLMNNAEGLDHFLTKAIIFWHLRQKNHDIFSEAKTKKGKIDLIDNTKKTLIEIEGCYSKNRIEKDKKKLSNDFRNIYIIKSLSIPYTFKIQIQQLLNKLDLV